MPERISYIDITTSIATEKKEPYIFRTEIDGVVIFQRPFIGDDRGSFQEGFRIDHVSEELGHPIEIKQFQRSVTRSGWLRGIHCEPMVKIITPERVQDVTLYCVVVDLRTDSPTFKDWVMIKFGEIDEKSPIQTFVVPEGCGNSFCVVPDEANEGFVEYLYSQTKIYNPSLVNCGIRWDDPTLNIPWPIQNPQVSTRDTNLQSLEGFLDTYR